MISDDDDYDNDLEEEEEEHSTSKGKGRKKKTEYRIKNALKVPRATTYTAQALYEQIHSADIDLDPEYQRDVVWPQIKQINLIDSIFRNFYIPPVIFSVTIGDDGSETRTCIDGKQRLTSIHLFMDGLIPHKDSETKEKLWFRDVGDGKKTKRLLPEKVRRLFSNKQIVCVEYADLSDADERDIFTRVQLGMALTPAEKLNVVDSPRARFVQQLIQDYCSASDSKNPSLTGLEWDRSRGNDFRCLGQAWLTIDKGSTAKSAGTVVQLDKWLRESTEVAKSVEDRMHNTFTVLTHLIGTPDLVKVLRKRGPKFAPVDLILSIVLVDAHKDTMNMQQLADAIDNMRMGVREVHKDIRLNETVTRTMLELIRSSKAKVSPGTIPASKAVPPRIAPADRSKRKRDEDESLEEEAAGGNAFSAPSSPPHTVTVKSVKKKRASSMDVEPAVPNPVAPRLAVPPDRLAAVRAATSSQTQSFNARNPQQFAAQPPQHYPYPYPPDYGPSSKQQRR